MNPVQFYNSGKFSVDIPARRSHARPRSRHLLRFEGLERRDLLSAYSLWSSSATPQDPAAPDSSAVEVGVKFTSDVAGSITGIRFYKGSGNTGTHVGDLWSSTGQKLASATFSNETTSGWQQVNFATPVTIQPNTVYVASYHTNRGHYADDPNYFASSGVDNGPLHAPADGASGPNGVYAYGRTSAFPTNGRQASNYWVDVVFSPADTPPPSPTVTGESPAPGATGVATTTGVTATFSESVQSGTISFVLKGPNNNVIPATVSYSDATHTATLAPSAALAGSTAYTATVSGAKDQAGNTMAAPVTWSFTTTAAAPSSTVSVKDFGAKGDGVTDDSAAIQAAVESLAATGGTVFVPAGDYRLSTAILLDHDNITLTGQGSASILQVLPTATQTAAIQIPDSPVSNVTISNLVCDGNHNPIVGVSGQCGIWLQQGNYVTLSGVIVQNWPGDGIQIANGSNPDDHVTVEDCEITGVRRNGIHVGDATNTTIEDNYINDCPSQYWGPAAGAGIDVEVEGYNANGTNPYGSAPTNVPFVDNLTIKDNVIERQDSNTAGAAIALQPAYGPVSKVTITGNLLSGHQAGVIGGGTDPYYGNIPALDHVTVSGNWIDSGDLNAIGAGLYFDAGAADLTFTNNVIHDQAGNWTNGIYLDDVAGATVSGNTIMRDNNAHFASIAVLDHSSNVTLSKNTWQTSLNPETPYSYLQTDPTVTNLTDDGGIPLDPSAVGTPPPTVSLGIASGTVISSPTPITIDTSGAVARVYFFIDGVPDGFSDSGTGPYVFTLDPSHSAAGPHVLEALAVDRSANVSAASQVSVQVVTSS